MALAGAEDVGSSLVDISVEESCSLVGLESMVEVELTMVVGICVLDFISTVVALTVVAKGDSSVVKLFVVDSISVYIVEVETVEVLGSGVLDSI